MNESLQQVMEKNPIIAHRGCWDYRVPENSPTAFRRAVKAGFGIELDVHLLADGNIAVAHDSTLLRMCFKLGKLENMTTEQLKKCRLHFSKECIPTFKEVLEIVDGRVPVYIELKCRDNEIELADALLKALNGYVGDYVFIGFHPIAGKYLKEKGYLVGYSCATPPESMDYAPDCMICHILGTPESAEERTKYPPFVPWTVSAKFMRSKAERVSTAAIYNTKEFKEFKFAHKD